MSYRHVTPPSEADLPDLQCPGGSASTTGSFPRDLSPGNMTFLTTPPRSPMRFRESGSRLLPKLRDQDHITEPVSGLPSFPSHSRTTSLPSTGYPVQFGPFLQKPVLDRRSMSPQGRAQVIRAVPTPAPSPYEYLQVDVTPSRRPSIGSVRSVSSSHVSNVRSVHSRDVSSSGIDESTLRRYGYPTYRHSPTPQPAGMPTSRTPSAMSHLTPIALPGGQVPSYPNNSRRTASPAGRPSRLSVEVEVESDPADLATSTVLGYLTAPNPTPSLIRRITETNKSQNSHFWFDIRNLRSWSDFNISTISAIPRVTDLLQIDVPASALPNPGKVNLSPETPAQLAALCANYHAIKVNAALRVAQGQKHIALRTLRPVGAGARQQPEFVANYQSDAEKTIFGDDRGRVVGIVKSYEQWNTGYRNGNQVDRIRYLEHLSHLHRFMREHGTRYGFILTEIELVCVRAGGPPSEDNIPLFGYLEVAAPVQVSASGGGEAHGALKMTVGLALWYLHMLAKEQPFPGQFHWRLDVGGPAALTRKKHLPRDEWMPKVNQQDKRASKRIRGWLWPDEPLHKRECVRGKRK